ncbi:MAG: hypothetical protein DRQ88_08925 [Epsilonproteobacteria bacterium]|nr:MAG: hypothetical protein DRQ89_06510 [Campylobacterota bacterium]RLA65655.1 MAG: hypothetical protein DRQ88_08925 [Campylobacterota bacterium]
MRKLPLRALYIANAILYLVMVVLWIAIPEELTLNISLSFFNFFLSALIIIIDREKFSLYYHSSQFKNFSATVFRTVLIFFILGIANYLIFKHPVQFDLSGNKLNSLTTQTDNILSSIKGPINFKVFARKVDKGPIIKLLDLYRMQKGDLEIEFIDVELRPDLVKQYEVIDSGTIIVSYGEKSFKFRARTELQLTNAIIKVTRVNDPIIYYSTGHQEADLERKDKDGISLLSHMLKRSYFEVIPVQLAKEGGLPLKALHLMIWGPRNSFLKPELKAIDKFLKRGGRLIVALDPNFKANPLQGLRDLLREWGVNISNDLVVDSINHYQGSNGSIPIIKVFDPRHPITKRFKGPLFFPLVSSVEKISSKIKTSFKPLALTTLFPASWAEKTPTEVNDGKVTFSKGVDEKGPISVVAAVWENKKGGAKILAFGNSSFVVNGYASFGMNFTFLLNGVSWSIDEGRLISFNLPAIKNEPIFISSPQLGVIFYFSVVLAPILLFGTAIYFYRRRLAL